MENTKFKLTQDQSDALVQIKKWLKTPEPYFVLEGFSGTGKTALMGLLADHMSNSSSLWTAPTNKATKVLKSVVRNHRCITIYSALRLKMEEEEDTLKLSKFSSSDGLDGVKHLIIDEASMLSRDIFGSLGMALGARKFKTLFICDLAQLPPVGEDISPVSKLKCSRARLSTVVRHDNQILEMATHIRSFINTPEDITPLIFEEEKEVLTMNRESFVGEIIKQAKLGFESTKVIAWRNKRVDMYNMSIRKYLFGEDHVKSWVAGEKIMFAEPLLDQFITVDDEATIDEVVVSNFRKNDMEIRSYFIRATMDSGKSINFKVIHEDGLNLYNTALNKLAMEARQPKMGWKWKHFWELKACFQKIRYAYAITAHRSQGSTFSNVFVDMGDILANSNRNEAKKCLYVACSRASKRLYIKN